MLYLFATLTFFNNLGCYFSLIHLFKQNTAKYGIGRIGR